MRITHKWTTEENDKLLAVCGRYKRGKTVRWAEATKDSDYLLLMQQLGVTRISAKSQYSELNKRLGRLNPNKMKGPKRGPHKTKKAKVPVIVDKDFEIQTSPAPEIGINFCWHCGSPQRPVEMALRTMHKLNHS
jgi:hypothetical protein